MYPQPDSDQQPGSGGGGYHRYNYLPPPLPAGTEGPPRPVIRLVTFTIFDPRLKYTKELILILPLSSWNYERHDSHLTLVILQLQKTWFTSYPCHLVITKDMIHILQMSSILQLKLSLFSSYIHYGHLIIKTAMIHNNDSDNNNSHDSHCTHVHLSITIFMILILPMSIWKLQQPWFSSYTCPPYYYNSHDSQITHVNLKITTGMIHILHMSIWQFITTAMIHIVHIFILQVQQLWFTSFLHMSILQFMIHIWPMFILLSSYKCPSYKITTWSLINSFHLVKHSLQEGEREHLF